MADVNETEWLHTEFWKLVKGIIVNTESANTGIVRLSDKEYKSLRGFTPHLREVFYGCVIYCHTDEESNYYGIIDDKIEKPSLVGCASLQSPSKSRRMGVLSPFR